MGLYEEEAKLRRDKILREQEAQQTRLRELGGAELQRQRLGQKSESSAGKDALKELMAQKKSKVAPKADVSKGMSVSQGLSGAGELMSGSGGGGDVAGSTLSGAGSGAAIGGSIGGGYGAAIGGAIGGTIGLLKGIGSAGKAKKEAKIERIDQEGKEKQNALRNIMDGFRSALIR